MKKIVFCQLVGRILTSKFFLMGKLSFLLFFSMSMLSYGRSFPQSKITLKMENVTLKKALLQLHKQSKIRLLFSEDLIRKNTNISINSEKRPFQEILGQLLFGTGLDFKVIDSNQIAIVPYPATQFYQDSIKGYVRDNEGKPLEGVTIVEKGTTNGTTTDTAGYFFLSVKDENAVIVISRVGFNTVEVSVHSPILSNIRLASSSTKELNDVVVVGYGTGQRKELTSSIASVSGETLRKSPVATIDQAIQGRVAGVQVTSSTGDPGGQISVRIRGISTASPEGSSDPLYVVDDIVQSNGIAFLNPNDIESIDILKDAAALSIYGIRSANGVVLIKTKKGSNTGKVKVGFDGFTGVSKIWRTLDVLSIKEKAALNTEIIQNYNAQNAGISSFTPIQVNPEWATPERIANLPDEGTDWQRQVFHTGSLFDGTLNVAGGGNKTSYYFSVGHRNENGTMINSGFKRTSVRANVDAEANKWLKVGMTLNYMTSKREVVSGTNDDRTGFMQSAVLYPPEIPVYDANGGYGVAPVQNINWYGNIYNPVNIINVSNPQYTNNNFSGSVFADVKLPFGITYRSTFAGAQFSGTYSNFSGATVGSAAASIASTNLYAGSWDGYNWNWDNYASWSKWIKGHSIGLTAGHTAQYIKNTATNYSQSNFSNQSPDFQYIGLGDPSTISFPFTAPTELAYYSWFGRISYNYQAKYYFQITGRQDAGSPTYITNKPKAFFPAASLRWRAAKENFLKNVTFINDLSLRASYGEMGNIGSLAYPGYSLVKTNSNYGLGGSSQSGISLGQYASVTGTGWERLRQADIGLDFAALKNRLNITLDWYNRLTKGMRVIPKVRDIFGSTASAPLINLDGNNIKNSGFEAAVSYSGSLNKLNYSVSANGSVNNNKVLNLGDMDYIIPPDATLVGAYQPSRTVVGSAISSFYGFEYDGIYKSQDEINNAPKDLVGAELRPGDLHYKDLNKDGQIDESDKTIIGNPTPKYAYGFNLSLEYQNFDCSIFFQGVAGNKIYNYLYQQGTVGDSRYNEGINRLSDVKNRWAPENPNADFPRIAFHDYDYAKNNRFSSFWLQDGSYLRLKTFQLGYTVPTTVLNKLSVEKIRCYVSVNNLLTFTKYKGFDPEIGINSTGYTDVFTTNKDLQIGVDRGVYPQPRMLLVGLNIIF